MPKKLSYKKFLKTFEHAPRAAVSLLINDANGKILLSKRLKPPFENKWHLPGSFILKEETIEECIARIKKEELGLEESVSYKLINIFDDIKDDPRGHVIDIIYGFSVETSKIKAVNDTKEVKFFEKLPPDIGFNHKDTLKKLGYQ